MPLCRDSGKVKGREQNGKEKEKKQTEGKNKRNEKKNTEGRKKEKREKQRDPQNLASQGIFVGTLTPKTAPKCCLLQNAATAPSLHS